MLCSSGVSDFTLLLLMCSSNGKSVIVKLLNNNILYFILDVSTDIQNEVVWKPKYLINLS